MHKPTGMAFGEGSDRPFHEPELDAVNRRALSSAPGRTPALLLPTRPAAGAAFSAFDLAAGVGAAGRAALR